MALSMYRRTKIVATLGPATDDPKVLREIIENGVNVVRLNFSHGAAADHIRRIEAVRECCEELNRIVGILGDLQGPKIRIQRFIEGRVQLEEGAPFILDAALPADKGSKERVGFSYKELLNDVNRGDTLLLDDGRIVLWVEEVSGQEIKCRTVVGGVLSNNKGINCLGGGLSAKALTDKDREDIKLAAQIGVDYLAVSFPRSAADIHLARELLQAAGGKASIVAKIERSEAVNAIEEILAAADVVMIARGDLGVEIGDAELPGVQKEIIRQARLSNRIVITATQMMETMINNPIPTRAEVFDVANAVIDGTDAVMLSAETATGKFPSKAVAAMDRICRSAEKQRSTLESGHRMDTRFGRIDEAIAMAVMYTANHFGVKAIAALTESGSTPLWMSRISSGIPIFALTRHLETCRRVTLYRGVAPVNFFVDSTNHTRINKEVIEELVRRGVVNEGEMVIITKGDRLGAHGGTNAMTILRVGELIEPDT